MIAAPSAAAPNDLRQQLRDGTASLHRSLESTLDLLTPPLQRGHYLRLLQRFHGFYALGEPGLRAWLAPDFRVDRCKLPLLRQDLLALGMDNAAIDTLPVCQDAAALSVRGPPSAAPAILHGAQQTFGLLQVWLTQA